MAFDDLENYYTNVGEEVRGYVLENHDTAASGTLDELGDIPEFNGSVVYIRDTISQFNPFTDKSHQISDKPFLVGSNQFATAAGIKGGAKVAFIIDGKRIERSFKVDKKLKGTVAINPSFDSTEKSAGYRFSQVKIESI